MTIMSGNKVNPLDIPIKTQQRMHAFFVKTSAPRIVAREMEEERKRKELESQQNTSENK